MLVTIPRGALYTKESFPDDFAESVNELLASSININEKALCYFENGLYLSIIMNDFRQAQINFNKAIRLGKKCGDFALVGDAYEAKMENSRRQLTGKINELALEYFETMGGKHARYIDRMTQKYYLNRNDTTGRIIDLSNLTLEFLQLNLLMLAGDPFNANNEGAPLFNFKEYLEFANRQMDLLYKTMEPSQREAFNTLWQTLLIMKSLLFFHSPKSPPDNDNI